MVILISLLAVNTTIALMLYLENSQLRHQLEKRAAMHDLLLKKYFKLDVKPSNIGAQPVSVHLTAQDIAKKSQERHTRPVTLRKSWSEIEKELEALNDTKGKLHERLVNDIEQFQGPLPVKE